MKRMISLFTLLCVVCFSTFAQPPEIVFYDSPEVVVFEDVFQETVALNIDAPEQGVSEAVMFFATNPVWAELASDASAKSKAFADEFIQAEMEDIRVDLDALIFDTEETINAIRSEMWAVHRSHRSTSAEVSRKVLRKQRKAQKQNHQCSCDHNVEVTHIGK